jgi:hypothetical protein
MKILDTRTYRKAKVRGIRISEVNMKSFYEELNPENHTCYQVSDKNNVRPYWVEYSDRFFTIGEELIEGKW